MTRAEFDTWIEAHYTELLAVARRRTNSDEDAQDALQAALAGALANETYTRPMATAAPWPFFVNAVRGYADALRKGNASRKRLVSDVKGDRALQPESGASFSLGWKRPAPRAD